MALEFDKADQVRLAVAGLALGLGISVKVLNVDDGAVLLNNGALVSRGNGLYSLLWTHGRTQKTWCCAIYSYTVLLSTTTIVDYFTIEAPDCLGPANSGRAF